MGWNVCGNGVKTWLCYYILDMLIHRKPQPYRFLWFYPTCIQFPQSNAHRVGVASTNHTDKFWNTGSAEEYSSKEFDDWGVRSYARVLAILSSSCSKWMLLLISPMRQCNNLCNSTLFVLWYYHCMDVVFDWNLGNMIYNGHNTLRLCGFPFAEIRSLPLVSEPRAHVLSLIA